MLYALVGWCGLWVWSEMFFDGILEFDKVKVFDEGYFFIVFFCFGSCELYDWVDCNFWVRMLRIEKTNSLVLIVVNCVMTSVNFVFEVDLFG